LRALVARAQLNFAFHYLTSGARFTLYKQSWTAARARVVIALFLSPIYILIRCSIARFVIAARDQQLLIIIKVIIRFLAVFVIMRRADQRARLPRLASGCARLARTIITRARHFLKACARARP
jgi:hypothetical protein